MGVPCDTIIENDDTLSKVVVCWKIASKSKENGIYAVEEVGAGSHQTWHCSCYLQPWIIVPPVPPRKMSPRQTSEERGQVCGSCTCPKSGFGNLGKERPLESWAVLPLPTLPMR